MKIKLISISILMFLFSCGGTSSNHSGHNHAEGESCPSEKTASDVHDHEAEGHDHEAEGHNHEAEGHDHVAESAGEHNHEGGITFNAEQASKLDFQTVKAEVKDFKNVIKTSGVISSAQGDESRAVATVAGVVTFDKLRLLEGTPVKNGQTLVTISSGDFADDNLLQRVAEARTEYEYAEANLSRAEELKGGAVSEKDISSYRTAFNQAKLKIETLTKNLSSTGKTITAPIGGYIRTAYVKEGSYVNVGDPLFDVTKNMKIELRAEVPLKDYSKLTSDVTANFTTPHDNKTYSLKELNGRVVSVGKSADNSFYVPVVFEFDNKNGFVPGSYVEVSVISGLPEKHLTIPYSSLVEEQGAYSVYLRTCVDSYEKRYVKIGDNDMKEVVVIDGLKDGDEVVSRGAYFIKLASMSNSVPDAHNH